MTVTIRADALPLSGGPEDRGESVSHIPLMARTCENAMMRAPCTASRTQGLSLLSNRELQVAELVSRGHTNREIARMLTLSHKTIETHLSRIFAKLNVPSRAAVASMVARAER